MHISVTIATIALGLVATVLAVPELRKVPIIARNENCSASDDQLNAWDQCASACQYEKPDAPKQCRETDWDCIQACQQICSDNFCHGGRPPPY